MTKIITAIIIAAALYGGWELYFYWERVKNEEETAQKQSIASAVVPEQLPGMAPQLDPSLQAAQRQGATALKNWLKAYGHSLQDPRKAWIELDYCTLISQKDPQEAKRIFADVKGRTPVSSPVYARIKQLERTYE
ncbi:MAG TPA: hypothetical protein VNT26_13465 [Candidatus Sulfotelmatobacter sp.]|nr:hypothetical protein [Candidatus Sulfotelmatobacter sp.]HWI56962.1 hypothetical protein [Bacillota bacterium]